MNMKTLAVQGRFHQQSVESINLATPFIQNGERVIPVYGDFASQLADKLNQLYRKDADEDDVEKVDRLGRDFDGNSNHFNYQLGRKELVSGVGDIPATMTDTQLSVESFVEQVHTGGIGMYNITDEIAGIAKGVSNCLIWTSDYRMILEEDITLIRDLIVKAGKHVVMVLMVPKEIGLTYVKIKVSGLYELMESTNHLTVYLTYVL